MYTRFKTVSLLSYNHRVLGTPWPVRLISGVVVEGQGAIAPPLNFTPSMNFLPKVQNLGWKYLILVKIKGKKE